jgi:hypothetical protein
LSDTRSTAMATFARCLRSALTSPPLSHTCRAGQRPWPEGLAASGLLRDLVVGTKTMDIQSAVTARVRTRSTRRWPRNSQHQICAVLEARSGGFRRSSTLRSPLLGTSPTTRTAVLPFGLGHVGVVGASP